MPVHPDSVRRRAARLPAIRRLRWWWPVLATILLLAAARAQPARAQMGTRTIVQVPTAHRAQNRSPRCVADNHGGTFVLFKSRRGTPAFTNLYLQHIGPGGKRLLATAGEALAPQPANQTEAGLVYDGNDNLLVAWSARPPGKAASVFVQRLTPRAEPYWQPDPVRVSTGSHSQRHPKLLWTRRGNAFVFWEEQLSDGTRLMGQRLDARGNRLWGPDGRPVAPAGPRRRNLRLSPGPGGEMILVWEELAPAGDWHLRAQKMTPEGDAQWDRRGVDLRGPAEDRQTNAALLGDGFGGAVLAYEAIGTETAGMDIHALRLNRHGKVAYRLPLARTAGNQENPQLSQRGSLVLTLWTEAASDTAHVRPFGLNAGELTHAETRLERHTASSRKQPRLITASVMGNQLIAWREPGPASAGLYLRKLSGMGKPVWAEPVHVIQGKINDYDIIPDERGGAWLVWERQAPGGRAELGYRRILGNGQPANEAPRPLLTGTTAAPLARVNQLRALQRAGGDTFLAWQDFRNGTGNADIYLQKLDSRGRPQWKPGGIPICTAPGRQGVPRLIARDGGVVAAWQDRRGGEDNIYMQAVSPGGQTLWTHQGRELSEARRSQSSLRLVEGPGRDFYAVWTDTRDMPRTGFDLYMQRFDARGEPQWTPGGRALCRQTGFQTSVDVLPAPDGGFFAAWMDDRSGTFNIYLQHIRPAGTEALAHNGEQVGRANDGAHQRAPRLARLPDGGLMLVWSDDRYGRHSSKIVGRLRTPAGNWDWPAQGMVFCGSFGRQTAPKLRLLPGGDLLLTWLDARHKANGEGLSLYAQRLSPSGTPRWARYGQRIGELVRPNARYALQLRDSLAVLAWPAVVRPGVEKLFAGKLGLQTGRVRDVQVVNSRENLQADPHLLRFSFGRPAVLWWESAGPKAPGRILLKPLR